MTNTITLNLTLEELKTLDKYVELNDETRPLFDKIQNAYPEPETLLDVIRNLGYSYDCCYEIVDAVEKFEKSKEPEKWDVVRESVKWCEEHPDESVEDYLKPHTPEQTEKLLREAFQKVQQTEEWKETQRKIDAPKESWMNKSNEELVAMLEKNPPDCLKFVMGKTLEGLIEEWWIDVFTRNSDLSMEESIDCLVTMISSWLPKEQSAAGSQSLGVEDMVEGFNDCLKKIKSKLRNKKDT